jgi:hypothetical protein
MIWTSNENLFPSTVRFVLEISPTDSVIDRLFSPVYYYRDYKVSVTDKYYPTGHLTNKIFELISSNLPST